MDRAQWLAELADGFMETGRLPFITTDCPATSYGASVWPEPGPDAIPMSAKWIPGVREIRFSATFPGGQTIVCSRPISQYRPIQAR